MDRRSFIGLSAAGVAGATALGAGEASAQDSPRDYYELRLYHVDTDEQRTAVHEFMENAFIPGCNRIGIPTVGVFDTRNEPGPVYVLIRYTSAQSYATALQQLLADEEFMKAGKDFLLTDAKDSKYSRVESQFMISFAGMPEIELPVTGPERVFELRNYMSHSVVAGQKKIEMFNVGEIQIMRDTGLGPVLYGEHLAGPDMPNLTYFLSYENFRARGAAWKTFIDDPAWNEISSKPEYANERILSGIESVFLMPTGFSQM